jgi:homoserine kinase
VRVPATTANLGPGFDALGMALTLYNTLTVEEGEEAEFRVGGAGAERLAGRTNTVIHRAIGAVYERAGGAPPPLRLAAENGIPMTRGLGSSAAARAAGLVAANELLGRPLAAADLAALGTRLEGHPDNIVPALLGGCLACVAEGEAVHYARIAVPETLQAVLFIPDFEMPTQQARAVLPAQISRAGAVFNIGRTALLVASLASGSLENLAVATQDRLHQYPRQRIFPAMGRLFEAALAAGARAVWLSGAGSTICALADRDFEAIGEAMRAAGARAMVGGEVRVVGVDGEGTVVLTVDE